MSWPTKLSARDPPTLADLYRYEPDGTNAKDGLAVALAAATVEDRIADLIVLARDPQLGESRILLLRRLKRSRSAAARSALARRRSAWLAVQRGVRP